ncbi:MAG: hypothetical protein QM535_17620 [Limnohabitans sp.]|nr:hypothetical protein [Limnohabitans sp.]
MKLVNISLTVKLSCAVDLKKISDDINCRYNPSKFNGAILKVNKPRTTFLIFNSGYVVITGVKKTDDIEKSETNLTKFLRNKGYIVNINERIIRNLVFSGNFKKNINLPSLYNYIREIGFIKETSASYETELFPALICNIKNKKWSISIFHNGKYHMTGLKSNNEAIDFLSIITSFVNSYDNLIE